MSVQVKERWLRCGGYGTRFLEAGDPDAEPLLLIHDGAWGGSASTTWANLIPLLAPYRRVLAPDMLGYGASDKAVFLDRSPYAFRIAHLADFLRVLGISAPIDVVGNSFGGSTALRSLVMPDSFPIRSVVSIAGSGGPWRTPAALGELSRWDGTREDLARVVRFLVDDFPDSATSSPSGFAGRASPVTTRRSRLPPGPSRSRCGRRSTTRGPSNCATSLSRSCSSSAPATS